MKSPAFTLDQRHRIGCIADSYTKLTGRHLVPPDGDVVEALWSAPFAIVAHGTEADPIFYFGNQAALELFEMEFDAFARLPSRKSAEPQLRDKRADLLDRVTRHGIVDDYEGIRISATGRRFQISNASVWNVTDGDGVPIGQAAAFSDWFHLPR